MSKQRLRSPIIWFGGKGAMVPKLISLFPPNELYDVYGEVFGGGASLLFAKQPSPKEFYNDLDKGAVEFFRMLKDATKFERFYRLVCLTPYSRAEYIHDRDTWEDEQDDVLRAYKWFIVARMSFSGAFGGGWRFKLYTTTRNMVGTAGGWQSIIEMLPLIHERLANVEIMNKSFEDVIPQYNNERTFLYLDPPYILDTRRSGGYKHEMTNDDHRRLVDMIRDFKGMVMLSGYRHEIYDDGLPGWKRFEFNVSCYAAGRTRLTGLLGDGATDDDTHRRTECIWVNYDVGGQLGLSI